MGQGTELQGRRILVVEDDFVVAQALCGLIEEAGATAVGPIGFADEALAYIQSNQDAFNGVVLDVNLHGQKSYAIADWLTENSVDFVFTTGYGVEALDPAYAGCPRCEKPFDPRVLFRLLGSSTL
ncbi:MULTISPECIES: response regulator [unclassified Paraburkholderia]|uniref:response regulator n=1 Tax=unclassified Paraburkholderia TaxID=2615204 RepID=UPI001607234B|nr:MULTISPECIES: response regulator [unclassified Paraburkholderia]MBB5447359.1 CheY-like chemotaxis protein [Paraburkholderia sp. WSM4177]MBB5487899.1 CheY-like chemotaxis protein [Paraburkholderia sp. WSM4180]